PNNSLFRSLSISPDAAGSYSTSTTISGANGQYKITATYNTAFRPISQSTTATLAASGPTSTVSVTTDTQNIVSSNGKITIRGQVTGIVQGQEVMIQFTKPDGSMYPSNPVPIESIGGALNTITGSYSLSPAVFADVGKWTITVTYNN